MSRDKTELPVERILPELCAALDECDSLILEAPPGAGKTTLVPLALLNAGWLSDKKILMLQPRRIATRAAAERMSALLGERIGETVGYQIRQESKVSPLTKIVVMTEGILTRRLQQDPALSDVAMVILDEFHERNLNADLGLALCLQSREIFRETPLKLILMSATLDSLNLKDVLPGAVILRSEGRSYPVDIVHLRSLDTHDRTGKKAIVEHTVKALTKALEETQGDVLAFLPGRAEIESVHKKANELWHGQIDLHSLYGSMPVDAQRSAISASRTSALRRVVLATDIAETSLTIEGVTVVIDSGLARVPQYDPRSGLTRLATRRISKASATQRMGRAGRTAPGTCYRLWSEEEHQQLAEQYPAEILNADLTPLALQLFQWGVNDFTELRWLDSPPSGTFSQAVELLLHLGAIEQATPSSYRLTDHGAAMSTLPLHPRLAHMLVVSREKGMLENTALVAALLSERDSANSSSCDMLTRIDIVDGSANCPANLQGWKQRMQNQSRQIIAICSANEPKTKSSHDKQTQCAIALSYAYPDRIAKRITDDGQYKLSQGAITRLDNSDPLIKYEWLVVADSGGRAGQRESRIFLALAIDAALFRNELARLLTTEKHVYWNDQRQAVIAEELVKIGKNIIERKSLANVTAAEKTQAMKKYLQEHGLEILPWTKALRQWQARVMLLRSFDEQWPDVSDDYLKSQLDTWLMPFLSGITSIEGLKNLPLKNALTAMLPWPLPEKLDELAPEKIHVPSGSAISIDYLHTPPVLAVKLQEMFGCHSTPCIANGRVALLVHLLSPARRPIQVTQDLGGFWKSSYHEVKKEMKGRYPKHPWPDDPISAEATRLTKKRLNSD